MTSTLISNSTSVQIDPAELQQFEAGLRGRLVKPQDPDYDDVRALYNAMIDKRPALIVRCTNVADVVASVNFAREQDLLLAVRGGGHSGPGMSSCDDGLVVDLTEMNGIRIDPEARIAWVEGGCLWGDVDHATHAFGLAVPSGMISTTGVGGLTLGGGVGHLSRRFGLTIDNLLGVDMVLADGSFVTANAEQNQDLFWAVRGGGGNFGVVTSFQFQLHPVDNVVSGPTLWPLEKLPEVLRWYQDFLETAPRELSGWFGVLVVPPTDLFPKELHMQTVCGCVWNYSGPMENAEAALAPIRAFGPPIVDGLQQMPFPVFQSAFDPLYPKGEQWYWKTDFFTDISEEEIGIHLEFARQIPTLQSTMHLYPINGAAQDAGPAETAWGHRHAKFAAVIIGVDPDPANNERTIPWARSYWNALHPFSAGGSYINMMMDEGEDRSRDAYGENYDRLASIKQNYDPGNLFRVNQNIAPAR